MNRFAWRTMVALLAALGQGAAFAAVFNVTVTTDGGPGSLRQAIIDANASAGADTINLPAGTYVLNLSGASENAAATGDLDITDSLTINGAGSALASVNGGGGLGDRIFDVIGAGTVVALNGLTIASGSAGGSASGGGIQNAGVLTLTDVVVANNTAGIQGGGIASSGTLTLTSSVVRNNTAGQGGGVFTRAFTATDCTIANNSGPEQGGGLFVASGAFSMTRCTIDNNSAGDDQGGGMFVIFANGTLTNVTISNNTAATGSGGGIFNNPPRDPPENVIRLVNSTVANNTGGGLRSFGNEANFSILNTIVASNGPDCPNTTVASEGFNLITDTTTCTISGVTTGNILNVGANLGPLADNGGPTQTRGLNAGSPAIDAATAVGAPPTDQRGVARPVGAGFDIGAFEGTLGGVALPTLSIDNVAALEGNAGNTAFTFTVTLSAASAATVTVNFATANGSATVAGSDYLASNGVVTFAPGQTSRPVVVQVIGDTAVETNETFVVNLSAPAEATIATGQGTGTIINDDGVVVPPEPPTDIPTLSQWALMLLALLLAGSAILPSRRRRR